MKLSSIAIVCSLTVGGKTLGFAKAAGVYVDDGSNLQVWLGQNETSETPASDQQGGQDIEQEVLNNCTMIQDWDTDPNVFLGTEYAEIKDKCESGEISTEEEVAAEVEEVLSPNLSIDEQISSIANDICESLSSGNETDVDASGGNETDIDASSLEAACSAEPRDDEAVVVAASKIQAKNTPKDEEWEAELEETCTSIRENRDKIEAALLVLAASSSERRLQDGSDSDSQTPVSSFEMATDMLGMYDCICDQSNPDNIGCLKKTLKFTTVVSQSIEEQAAEDFDPERIFNDVEETIKTYTHHLRHSGHNDSNDATLSLARAVSEVDESLDVSSSVGVCDPPGITPTPENDGMKLCLYAGPVFECEVSWTSHSKGCASFECGAGAVLQLKGSVQVSYVPTIKRFRITWEGPVIELEIKLCVNVISEILQRIGTWIPSTEKLFNKFNIYGGCYRLALAKYDVENQRLEVIVPTTSTNVFANVRVYHGAQLFMRFKVAPTRTLSWWTYELAARSGRNLRQVYPDFKNAQKPWKPNQSSCPLNSGSWSIFQLYFKVRLDFWFKKTTVWSFDKYYVAK